MVWSRPARRSFRKSKVWIGEAPEEFVLIKVPSLHGEVDRLLGADVERDGKAALLLLQLEVQSAGAGEVANLQHHLLYVLLPRMVGHLDPGAI